MSTVWSCKLFSHTKANTATEEDNKKPKKKAKTGYSWATVNGKKDDVKEEEQDSAFEEDESEEVESTKAVVDDEVWASTSKLW